MFDLLRNWFFGQWAKIALGASFAGAALIAYWKHRNGIVDDAQDEVVQEIREKDHERAREIRDSVDAARGNIRVRPREGKDDRGYRD